MKALSLWQPWATLIVVGAKRIETRDWGPPFAVYGERIAIHATRGVGPAGEAAFRRLCDSQPFHASLAAAGYGRADELPRGAVVGTVRLARASRIDTASARELEERNPREFAFGNYAPGRWAWVLEDPQRLEPPLETGGQRKLWDVELERPTLFS